MRTFDDNALTPLTASLKEAEQTLQRLYPGEPEGRQPVHTVYGGAHLFQAGLAQKLGKVALRSLEQFADGPEKLASVLGYDARHQDLVYKRVIEKLEREPVEDFRIDFEDGYGNRSDEEEDGHAVQAAEEVAVGMREGLLPPFIGIRIKTLSPELRLRSLRTLDIFVSTLVRASGGKLPSGFVITLPKVEIPEEVTTLVGFLDALEPELGLAAGSIKMEIMIESPRAIMGADGRSNLPSFLQAAQGRCVAAHFGTYDYTASCNITAAHQHMAHPVCDFAKHMMQVAYANSGIWISDGATNIMPVAPHRGDSISDEERAENERVVHGAWRLHYQHTRHSLTGGFYQGWDLHPAQLPIRYAAVFAFFLEDLDGAGERLTNFVSKAAQATLVGDVFDDAATGQGLLNYFLRAVSCGAISEEDAVRRSGVTLDELRGRSFLRILQARKA
jgi:citrate lyase beta subunit